MTSLNGLTPVNLVNLAGMIIVPENGGLQAGGLSQLTTTLVPGFVPPSTYNSRQDVGIHQRLNELKGLILQQAKETSAIKQQLSSLKAEMEEVKAIHTELLSMINSSSCTTSPHVVSKKLPKELSVR